MRTPSRLAPAFILSIAVVPALAGDVQVRVTVENLAAANDIAFAPLRVGFGNGSFDAFDNMQAAFLFGEPTVATAPITTIAEGGSGSTWFPAFAGVEPGATLGTVVPDPAGPLLPGGVASTTFTVNPMLNRYFTFAAMVVPSNDHFIGNDEPMAFELFDMGGNLQIASISQFGRDIWDAGTEVTDPANAAFLVGGMNDARIDEGGVVHFDFAQLDAYNGLTTGAGYVFDRQFGAGDEIYRITFQIVPAPGAGGAIALAALAVARRRRA